MNKMSLILFLIYFGIFVGLGVLFYFKYADKFLDAGAEPEKNETLQTTNYIYYAQDNNLYRINPAIIYDSNQQVERFQSTGQVFTLDVSKNGLNLAYGAKNNLDFKEIWQVNTSDQSSLKIATRGQENLHSYLDFINPKFSPDGTKLAFVGQKDKNDTIFIKNLASEQFEELIIQANILISDFTWLKDGQNIIYCAFSNGCWLQEISSNQARKIITGDVSQISANLTDRVIYLLKLQDSGNLFSGNPDGSNIKALTNILAPKTIVNFQIDQDGQNLTYSIKEDGQQNVYFSQTDGANRLQLTTDNSCGQPVISPDGTQIAYYKQNDGVYLIDIDKKNNQKITNLPDTVRVIVWR